MAERLVKDRAAEEDLIEIWLHTRRKWGERQADQYLATPERQLQALAEFPNLGRLRDELRPGVRSKRAGWHVIFYLVTESDVRIRRVLHSAMDVESQFEDADEGR